MLVTGKLRAALVAVLAHDLCSVIWCICSLCIATATYSWYHIDLSCDEKEWHYCMQLLSIVFLQTEDFTCNNCIVLLVKFHCKNYCVTCVTLSISFVIWWLVNTAVLVHLQISNCVSLQLSAQTTPLGTWWCAHQCPLHEHVLAQCTRCTGDISATNNPLAKQTALFRATKWN